MTCVPRKHTITPSRHLPASTPPIYRVAYNAIAQQDVESACQSLEASPQLPSLLFSRSGAASADSRDGAGKAGEAEIVKEESMVCDRCGREDFKNMQVLVPAFPRTVSLA